MATTSDSEGLSVAFRKNDIFVSYCRRDKEFVQRLDAAFRKINCDPWIDWDDIQKAEEWRKAITHGIVNADTFIFVISPDSVASVECQKEIDQAIKYNKRIIPIVYRDATNVHPALAELNWLFFRATDDFETEFQKLLDVIKTDLKYVQMHTRLLARAIEWEDGRDDGFLLRGKDLATAESWLVEAEAKEPAPTGLQRKYITKSREVENAVLRLERIGKQAKWILGTTGVALLVAVLNAVIALQRSHQLTQEITIQKQEVTDLEQKSSSLQASIHSLTQHRKTLFDVLKVFGWTEQTIEALLQSGNISSKVEEIKQANILCEKTQQAARLTKPFDRSSDLPQRNDITVRFYPKDKEWNQEVVQPFFEGLGFKSIVRESEETIPNNTILYGNVAEADVKLIAYCMMRAGVQIRSIEPFHKYRHQPIIQVEAEPKYQKYKPLSAKQVQALQFIPAPQK
jgi:hypothetical protein